jgi:GLPGLI family protein
MRKMILPLLFSVLCFTGYAQSDSAFATVKYKLTHISDTTWPENPQVTNYILYLGKKLTNYTNFDREESMRKNGGGLSDIVVGGAAQVSVSGVSNASAGSNMQGSQRDRIAAMGNIYKKVNEGKLLTIEYTYGQLFAVEDQMPEINWSIQPDTKEIMGLPCQKAVGDFRGRTYEAWFCSQLPYSNGPWKLNGLPGLIIEAADTKREVIFSFVGFENLEEKKLVEVTPLASKTSPKEFKQYKEALEKDSKAMAGSTVAAGGVISVRGMLAVGPDGKPPRFRQMNNPIEKEVKK